MEGFNFRFNKKADYPLDLVLNQFLRTEDYTQLKEDLELIITLQLNGCYTDIREVRK